MIYHNAYFVFVYSAPYLPYGVGKDFPPPVEQLLDACGPPGGLCAGRIVWAWPLCVLEVGEGGAGYTLGGVIGYRSARRGRIEDKAPTYLTKSQLKRAKQSPDILYESSS